MRTAFGTTFDLPTGYLNTPSIGGPPAEVAEAVAAAVGRWRAAADTPGDFEAAIAESRAGFAWLAGVPAERVAVGANASQFVGLVAAGLPDGARVLVAENEFTSVTFPFAAHADRGITVTELPLDRLPAAAPGYDLVAVSVVQSADGGQVDLAALRAAGVPVLLDVSQAAGWHPLRLDWADWVVGVGYKWLMAPRGAAWLAVHPRVLERTRPVAASWYGGEEPWQSIYGLPLRLAASARRFDLSPVWLGHLGAAASFRYLRTLDPAGVRAHCVGLADELLRRLGLPGRDSAIVSITHPAPERLAAAGIVSGNRAGRTRLGFHLYNTLADVDAVANTFE